MIAVLVHYPLDVVQAVADPYYGLPSKQSFMPTAHEVRQACDAIHLPRLRAARHQAAIEHQLSEREAHERHAAATRVSSDWWDRQRLDLIARGITPPKHWLKELGLTEASSKAVA